MKENFANAADRNVNFVATETQKYIKFYSKKGGLDWRKVLAQ
jgi:hypothetical protein